MLLFDMDGTLCQKIDMPPIWECTPAEALQRWERLLYLADPGLVHPELVRRVDRLLEVIAQPVAILTARHIRLAALTAEWIWRKVPPLRDVPLSMRLAGDDRASVTSKQQRLNELRAGARHITLVDDDDRMLRALAPDDLFLQAPGIWARDVHGPLLHRSTSGIAVST